MSEVHSIEMLKEKVFIITHVHMTPDCITHFYYGVGISS